MANAGDLKFQYVLPAGYPVLEFVSFAGASEEFERPKRIGADPLSLLHRITNLKRSKMRLMEEARDHGFVCPRIEGAVSTGQTTRTSGGTMSVRSNDVVRYVFDEAIKWKMSERALQPRNVEAADRFQRDGAQGGSLALCTVTLPGTKDTLDGFAAESISLVYLEKTEDTGQRDVVDKSLGQFVKDDLISLDNGATVRDGTLVVEWANAKEGRNKLAFIDDALARGCEQGKDPLFLIRLVPRDGMDAGILPASILISLDRDLLESLRPAPQILLPSVPSVPQLPVPVQPNIRSRKESGYDHALVVDMGGRHNVALWCDLAPAGATVMLDLSSKDTGGNGDEHALGNADVFLAPAVARASFESRRTSKWIGKRPGNLLDAQFGEGKNDKAKGEPFRIDPLKSLICGQNRRTGTIVKARIAGQTRLFDVHGEFERQSNPDLNVVVSSAFTDLGRTIRKRIDTLPSLEKQALWERTQLVLTQPVGLPMAAHESYEKAAEALAASAFGDVPEGWSRPSDAIVAVGEPLCVAYGIAQERPDIARLCVIDMGHSTFDAVCVDAITRDGNGTITGWTIGDHVGIRFGGTDLDKALFDCALDVLCGMTDALSRTGSRDLDILRDDCFQGAGRDALRIDLRDAIEAGKRDLTGRLLTRNRGMDPLDALADGMTNGEALRIRLAAGSADDLASTEKASVPFIADAGGGGRDLHLPLEWLVQQPSVKDCVDRLRVMVRASASSGMDNLVMSGRGLLFPALTRVVCDIARLTGMTAILAGKDRASTDLTGTKLAVARGGAALARHDAAILKNGGKPENLLLPVVRYPVLAVFRRVADDSCEIAIVRMSGEGVPLHIRFRPYPLNPFHLPHFGIALARSTGVIETLLDEPDLDPAMFALFYTDFKPAALRVSLQNAPLQVSLKNSVNTNPDTAPVTLRVALEVVPQPGQKADALVLIDAAVDGATFL